MQQPSASLHHLLALNPLQRRVVAHLTRQGAADAQTLATQLQIEPAAIEQVLAVLRDQGQIELNAAGQATVRLGRTRQRTLPARLWPALTASSRLYSAQEIATLRTVVPILQFARAKLSEFADHGPGHVLRVKSFATQLGYLLGLTASELHLLRAGALFHDVGNIVDRHQHHVISQETVLKLTAQGALPLSAREAEIIGLLCRWHRKEYDPQRCDEVAGQPIRTGLLASLLRVADAMDIDQRRVDYSEQFLHILRFFYPQELPYWTSLAEIAGVRIHCAQQHVTLQVFTHGVVTENMQIAMLEKDLAQTPLDWTVCSRPVLAQPDDMPAVNQGNALVVLPFEPHSLVMAALSRQHLQAAGYTVQLLCYPDEPNAALWLWREGLLNADPAVYTRLVIIGDRPEATVTEALLTTVAQWQTAGVSISLLNRHEANWARLPRLLQAGVEVIVGGDWAYFWGNAVTPQDLSWGRIAALCTRDPTQSTVGLTPAEEIIARGLLQLVYAALHSPPADLAGWATLATAICDQITATASDQQGALDASGFAAPAAAFATLDAAPLPTQIHGKAVLLELTKPPLPAGCFWALEAVIEAQGRTLARGIHFRTPYAIAWWADGDAVELLAINHWREEEAVPIRLLYPTDLGPEPEGNESTLRLRLSAAQAQAVIRALVATCNAEKVVSKETGR